jgi:hypothetical protein
MRTTLLSLCLVCVSSTGFAAPIGKGNFRRHEALRAAGVSPSDQRAFVRGLAMMAGAKRNPQDARILFVEDGATKKVVIVRAPLDKGQPVQAMRKSEAHQLGLITQAEARKLASVNGGKYGTKAKIRLKDRGIGYDGTSYLFQQTAPLGYPVPGYRGMDGKPVMHSVTSLDRSVPVTGQKGESASGWTTLIK